MKLKKPNKKKSSPIRFLIVGGVAGGATAAARARRIDEHAEIILFERGEYISFANCGLPYYLGGVIEKREELLLTDPASFSKRYRIDVRIFHEVVSIDRAQGKVTVKDLSKGEVYEEEYDRLLLSPGAMPLRMPFEQENAENVFHVRTLPDSDRITDYINNHGASSAVVVGGGYIGLEMADNLARKGMEVAVIEKMDQVMAPLDYEMAAMVYDHLVRNNVECRLNTGVESISCDNGHILVSTDRGDYIKTDLVIISTGVMPENRLAKEAGLEIGDKGGIRVNEFMQTSDPHIYAVGDAVEIKDLITDNRTITALAGPANKQARVAADNALGRNSVFKGTIGTAIAKVFDVVAACTGASEKILRRSQTPYRVSYTYGGSNASYYPNAEMMAIKLIFSPGSGKILGAQIVGKKGVDKRIDVLATAIHGSMSVFDLEELELAYAPPFSSAKDPVNMAGFVASNMLKGDLDTVNWDQIGDLDRETDVLLDLRVQEELDETGLIDSAMHIPLDDLRNRLHELGRDKHYILYCAVGMRGYLAHRILAQNGFKSKNLSGGIVTYLDAHSIKS